MGQEMMIDFKDVWNNHVRLLRDGLSLDDLRVIQERDREQLKNVKSAREKWLEEKRQTHSEERKNRLQDRARIAWDKIRRLRLRVEAANSIFNHLSSPKSQVSYPPSQWENLDDSDQRRAFPKNTLTRYKEAIREILKANPPGTFESKTELYRKVDDHLGNDSGDACRGYLNRHMENEPSDEEEWRKYLLEAK